MEKADCVLHHQRTARLEVQYEKLSDSVKTIWDVIQKNQDTQHQLMQAISKLTQDVAVLAESAKQEIEARKRREQFEEEIQKKETEKNILQKRVDSLALYLSLVVIILIGVDKAPALLKLLPQILP